MSFVIRRLRLAEEDALEAALWYDEREPALGEDFLREVEIAVQSLARDALLHRIRFGEMRRAPVRRFKYYGIYTWSWDQRSGSLRFITGAAIQNIWRSEDGWCEAGTAE